LEISDELRDMYRYVQVEGIRWDYSIIIEFVHEMHRKGITTDITQKGHHCVHWSGFSSQGDGACFEGRVANMEKFFKAHNLAGSFPMVQLLAEESICAISWTHQSSHYCHENTLRFSADYGDFDEDMADKFQGGLRAAWNITLEDQLGPFTRAVETIVKNYCKKLYRRLEREYDYLTSDEVVDKYIREHIMTGDEDGI
jgi:hypothetical protein